MKKHHHIKLFACVFWAALLLSLNHLRGDLPVSGLVKQAYLFTAENPYGPLLYLALHALRPFAFVPVTVLILLSGSLFGFGYGLLFAGIGEMLAANLAYFIGYALGKETLHEGRHGLLARWEERLLKNGFESVMSMHLMHVPFDLISFGSGYLEVRWRDYFLGTLVGFLPGMIMMVSLGASIENMAEFDFSQMEFNKNLIFISASLLFGTLLVHRWLHRRHATQLLCETPKMP